MDEQFKQKLIEFDKRAKEQGVPQGVINQFIKDKIKEHRDVADQRQVIDLEGKKVLIDGNGNILKTFDVEDSSTDFSDSEANFGTDEASFAEPQTEGVLGELSGDIGDFTDAGSTDISTDIFATGLVKSPEGINIPTDPTAFTPNISPDTFAEAKRKLGIDPLTGEMTKKTGTLFIPGVGNVAR